MTAFEAVIGLEVHAQLLTQSKLFCGCSNRFGLEPNTRVCPVCLGLPGSLPVINQRAVELALRAALALGCRLNPKSQFARKQYFYPDSPKGYQISQFEQPYCEGGELWIELGGEARAIRLTRIHMEEDAGKSIHGVSGDSVVDLNRAGTPLIEIVSEPELRSSAEAAAYLRELSRILMFLAVNDGNLEEGSFRCDANVSIRPRGSDVLGTRTELKNLNSFRFVQRAIDEEIARQTGVVLSGGRVVQETRAFDPDSNATRSLRSKEQSHDYRYFPDPDLPPLVFTAEQVDFVRQQLPELPAALRARLSGELGLSAQAAATLSSHPAYAQFFEETLSASNAAALAGGYAAPPPVKLGNWILTEVLRSASSRGLDVEFKLAPAQIAELLGLVESEQISGKQAKEIHAVLEAEAPPGDARRPGVALRSPREVMTERGMQQLSDSPALEQLVLAVIADSPKQVEQYRGGKTGLLGYFVGQVMQRSGGQANPKQVSELLRRALGGVSE